MNCPNSCIGLSFNGCSTTQYTDMQTAVTYNEDALRVVSEEVQNPPALLEVVLGVGAQAPDQVRELDAIPHKEHLHEATKVRAVSHTCIKPVAPE